MNLLLDAPPPMAHPPAALSLEAYAAASAHLTHTAGRPPDEVLAELGIPAEAWRASVAEWERALDEENARGEHALVTAFAAKFHEVRADLVRSSPPAPPPAIASPPLVPTPRPAAPLPPEMPEAPPPAAPDPPQAPPPRARPRTAAVDRRDVERPVMPFPLGDPPGCSPEEDAARREFARAVLPFGARSAARARPEPPLLDLSLDPPRRPASPRIDATTARLDARWLPPLPEISVAPATASAPASAPASASASARVSASASAPASASASASAPRPAPAYASPDEAAALLLVRIKQPAPPAGLRGWLARAWRWLFGGPAA